MRPFESYFVYSSLLCCLYPCVYTAAVAFVFMMIHMVKEFPRWQFALAYFYVISNVILFYLESTDSEYKIPIGFWGHLVLQLLGVVFVFGSSALACLLPVVTFKSTGKFKVGMEEIHIKDEGQNFLARIFYPTMDKGKKLKYLKHGLRSSNHFAKFARLPSVILSHMTLFKMDVIEHAALISEKESTYGKYFPVVVFSHGLGGTYECYSSFVIELASHGYIVLVPLHNDKSASYVEFPDGNITHYERLPSHKLKVGKNFEFEFRNSQVNHRAQECRVLLDFLHEISSKNEVESAKFSKFFNRVDMDKVAIVGHSFGGATSLQVCFTDQRFRCAIALDTWMLPISQEMLETGIKAPLLMIVSEEV